MLCEPGSVHPHRRRPPVVVVGIRRYFPFFVLRKYSFAVEFSDTEGR